MKKTAKRQPRRLVVELETIRLLDVAAGDGQAAVTPQSQSSTSLSCSTSRFNCC